MITGNDFLEGIIRKQILNKPTINKKIYNEEKMKKLGPYQMWYFYITKKEEKEILEGHSKLAAMYMGTSGYFRQSAAYSRVYSTKELFEQFNKETNKNLSLTYIFPNCVTKRVKRNELVSDLKELVGYILQQRPICIFETPDSHSVPSYINYAESEAKNAVRKVLGSVPHSWFCSYEYPRRLRNAWSHSSVVIELMRRCKKDSIDNKTRGCLYCFTGSGPKDNLAVILINREFTVMLGGHTC